MQEPRHTPSWTAPYRLVVALRLLRVRKINLISILGVMLGIGSIIVVMAVMDGFQRELRTMIRGTLSDVIVELPDPRRMDSFEELSKEVEAVPGVAAVTLQLHTFGAIPGQNRDTDGGRQNYMPVRIVGLLPDREATVSDVLGHMDKIPGQPDDPFVYKSDENFIPSEKPRVVISEWTAKRLGGYIPLDPGMDFVLITFAEVGSNGGHEYRANDRWVVISRVYNSGNSEYDKVHLYVDLSGTGKVFFPNLDNVIAELRIRLDDYNRAGELRGDIARAVGRFDPMVGERPDRFVETWEQRQRNLLRAVNNEKFLLAFVLFFIVLVGCFTIFATLTMTVVEKTRDIGVLRALGATPAGICSIFVLNGTLVGSIGAALGYGVGILLSRNVNPIRNFLRENFGWDIFPADIYLFEEIPTYIDHGLALYFALGAALSALVFAIIPAVRAARLKPVSALRYE